MAFLTILAIGTFGLLIAGVSHISISRERKALMDAKARTAEVVRQDSDATGASDKDAVRARFAISRGTAGRQTLTATKQYRRVRGK